VTAAIEGADFSLYRKFFVEAIEEVEQTEGVER
jgi:hypothetical protein